MVNRNNDEWLIQDVKAHDVPMRHYPMIKNLTDIFPGAYTGKITQKCNF